jgi:hypothetical protein
VTLVVVPIFFVFYEHMLAHHLYCCVPAAAAAAAAAAAVQPLLASDTLQELIVAFYDQQGHLTSKVSFIIQVQGSKPSTYSSSSSSSSGACSPLATHLAGTQPQL